MSQKTALLPFSMTFLLVSLNHKNAPLVLREHVAFHPEEIPRALKSLYETTLAIEATILSTCNRTEILLLGDASLSKNTLLSWLSEDRKIAKETLLLHSHFYQDASAVSHLFRVTSSLESAVLGESQILGQVKTAVHLAKEAGFLGFFLHRLFQDAFATAKKVRSQTAIGEEVVSFASAGVTLFEEMASPITEKSVLFIGAGEIIAHALAHFAKRNPKKITLANRTLDRGKALAKRYLAETIRLEELQDRLHEFDAVISCTASPVPIIGKGRIERALKMRQYRPMFLMDMALPRDMEAEIADLPEVILVDLERLASKIQSGRASREEAVTEAEAIIEEMTALFFHWFENRQNLPYIRSLRDAAERLRRHEWEYAKKRLHRGDPPEEVLRLLSERLTKKFLHAPLHLLNHAEKIDPPKDRNALLFWFREWFR